jgi:hypothetical protein
LLGRCSVQGIMTHWSQAFVRHQLPGTSLRLLLLYLLKDRSLEVSNRQILSTFFHHDLCLNLLRIFFYLKVTDIIFFLVKAFLFVIFKCNIPLQLICGSGCRCCPAFSHIGSW